MLKYFFGICLMTLLVCNNDVNVQASETVTDVNDFKWYEDSDGTVTITGYTGTDETVVIPSEINGKKVTSIAPWGLESKNFVNVILPDTMETIGEWAFEECKNLETINLPNSITDMGGFAFDSCKSLKSIVLPNRLKVIKRGLFLNCESLTLVEIPNTVESIELCAFLECKNLTNITIPNSVTNIGDGAFIIDQVNGIYSTIHANPNSYARTYAEQNGIKFKCLNTHSWDNGTVTTKATAINDGAKVYTCTACKIKKTQKISKLGLPKKGKLITESKSKNIYKVTKSSAKNGTVEIVKVNKLKSNITIPNTVTIDGLSYKVISISKNAFKNNKKIKKIIIGKNIKSIGTNAFYGCKNLKNIIVQSTQIKTIGKNTFKGIYPKAKIKVPKSKLKSYTKLFNKKGQKDTVKIIK